MVAAGRLFAAALALVALAAAGAALAGPAAEGGHLAATSTPSAMPPMVEPNVFEGTIRINGQPAPDGTMVLAVVEGELCGTDLTSGGRYRLVVEVHRCASPGDTVSFAVWAGFAAQTAAVFSPPPPPRTLHLTVGVEAPAAARLLGVTSGCSGESPGRAKITFMWDAGRGSRQWLDLSVFDNGFRRGTFISAGPFPVSKASYGLESGSFTWDGLAPGMRHFWRVNTVQGGLWAASGTGSFVTPDCENEPSGAATRLSVVTQQCSLARDGKRVVTFGWEPKLFFAHVPGSGLEYVTPGEQWLDISTFDNGFAPGTFVSIAVPASANLSAFEVRGIRGTVRHYWRVNTLGLLSPREWKPSLTHYFDAIQCSGQGP